MIHLSTKSGYAIKALVRLALANGDAPVAARDIVAFTGIPPKFLEQVMHDLRQAGLVESRRGKGGGYVIARSRPHTAASPPVPQSWHCRTSKPLNVQVPWSRHTAVPRTPASITCLFGSLPSASQT